MAKKTPPPVPEAVAPPVKPGDRVNYVLPFADGGAVVPADVVEVKTGGLLVAVRTLEAKPRTYHGALHYPAEQMAVKRRTNTWHVPEKPEA